MRYAKFGSLAVVFLFFSFKIFPQVEGKVLHIKPQQSFLNIGSYLQVYEDESNQLQLNDILSAEFQSKFKQTDIEVPGFGIDDVAIWVKIELANTSPLVIDNYLEVAFPTLDSVFFYYQSTDSLSWQELLVSDQIPFDQRIIKHKNAVFPLKIGAGQVVTVYLRIRNKGAIILPVSIIPETRFFASDLLGELGSGIFYGIMLVMLLYNLLLAYTARSITYIFYVGIIAGNLLTLSAINGHAFEYLWFDHPWWANHVIIFGIGLWILCGNLFAASFLNVGKIYRRYYIAFKLMQLLGLVVIVAAFVLDYKIGLIIANYGLIINCIFLFITGVFFWIKGVRVASFFTFAWVLYLTGVLLYTLTNLGFLPVSMITSHVLEIGAVSEVLLLSVSLGFKYRLLETDKNAAQMNALDLMTQAQQMMQQQNEQLESKILERTTELRERELEVVNSNEELNSQNEQLKAAQNLIQEQNDKLQHYNDNLENTVAERTADLKYTNQELALNVQKLEQYAYMTAHNLRAPVARLLGLTYLLELDPHASKKEWLDIISKIKQEGDSLDVVVKDLNAILELRKVSDSDMVVVNLLQKMKRVKKLLEGSLTLSNAEIICNFETFDTLKSNSIFVESIFYNLISNAIKYKHAQRSPEIYVTASIEKGHHCISVSDNGMGIDIKKHADNLFGMYRRFHTHVEGKGLGLFLVKSQMEILGGSVTVESELDEGSTFHLIFPTGV